MATWDVTAFGETTNFLTGTYNFSSNIIALDSTHYMFCYQHGGTSGYTQILSVDSSGVVTAVTQTQFTTDTSTKQYLYRISATKILVVYYGFSADGFAKIITVNPANWTISLGTPLEFDIVNFAEGSIEQLDTTHYLVTWSGASNHMRARVLEVDLDANTVVAAGAEFVVNAATSYSGATRKIDATHFAVLYTSSNLGYVQILEVNTSTWTITEVGTPTGITGMSSTGTNGSLNVLDATHFLVTFANTGVIGSAVVVEVNTSTWDTTLPGSIFASGDFSLGTKTNMTTIDNTHVFVTNKDGSSDGNARIYEVDENTWEVTNVGTPFEFDAVDADYISTTLIEETDDRVLVVWKGPNADGYARVLSVEVPVVSGGEVTIERIRVSGNRFFRPIKKDRLTTGSPYKSKKYGYTTPRKRT